MGQIDDSVRVSDLTRAIWRFRYIVLISTFAVTVISFVVLMFQPNVYQAKALLSPVSDKSRSALSNLAAQYGGLASLAGLNFGSPSGNQTIIGIETLKSRKFLGDFIDRHDLLISLFAADGWNYETGEISYDEDVFNTERGEWVRDVSPPKKTMPSREESIFRFREILRVRQDGDTGLVTISVEHTSPKVAQEWVQLLVRDINSAIKNRDVRDATRSIEYLEAQIELTPVAEIRSVFYNLIQEQVKTVMLANATDEYFLQTIDPPVAVEQPIGPRRIILSSVIFIISLLVSCVAAIAFATISVPSNNSKD